MPLATPIRLITLAALRSAVRCPELLIDAWRRASRWCCLTQWKRGSAGASCTSPPVSSAPAAGDLRHLIAPCTRRSPRASPCPVDAAAQSACRSSRLAGTTAFCDRRGTCRLPRKSDPQGGAGPSTTLHGSAVAALRPGDCCALQRHSEHDDEHERERAGKNWRGGSRSR